MLSPSVALANIFQSTLSVRRATPRIHVCIHVPVISIHALRKESDDSCPAAYRPSEQFQSTLSVRRATMCGLGAELSDEISIHALRKESDSIG